ncbi:DUF4062 domain-containing protein [Bacillus sp. H-16]|uniref:DUF4062 domain-containing protein n=1 Tax=Alteribacter salitolerans TaxID=2912333 RepID=UPI00196229D1|nr:tetratricopeptide repeat protein [Alteribacter salitolerans]MBM7096444.1 DUF4062 domain-containing protein [Alteribacter salitolerans]
MKKWNSRPIFISSTFKDMQAERDYLHYYVFPALEEKLKERHTYLEPIDLRWGINVVDVHEQEEKESLILEVCLAEINRSRPFLIVLLGDRYGWVPDQKQVEAVTQEAQYDEDYFGKSVTALEIEYGLLNAEEHETRGFYYFREPLPYDQMDTTTAAVYSDEYGEGEESRENYRKLLQLKKRISSQVEPARIRRYKGVWDSEQEEVTGLKKWGDQVLDDLWAEIEREYPPDRGEKQSGLWQHNDAALLHNYIEERNYRFVYREEPVLFMDRVIEESSGGKIGAIIHGESGSGKSSLLSHYYMLLKEREEVFPLFHAASFNPSSHLVERMLKRWISELSTFLQTEDVSDELATFQDVRSTFSHLLKEASSKKKVILLVDALDEMEQSQTLKNSTWLPDLWPDNARLIMTALREHKVLSRRHRFIRYELGPLTRQEAETLCLSSCKAYGKDLHPEVMKVLLSIQRDNGDYSYGNPLWLKLALDELILLDKSAYTKLSEFEGTEDMKLHKLILTIVSNLSGDIPSLYTSLMARVEKKFGKKLTESILTLIYASRGGLREKDLEKIVPRITGENWEKVRFAMIRRYLRNHLIKRGTLQFWNYYHRQTFEAIKKRYLKEEKQVSRLHKELAGHIKGLPDNDPLKEYEYIYQLLQTGNIEDAAVYYSNDLSESALSVINETISEFVSQDKKRLNMVLAFLHQSLNIQFTICLRFAGGLYASLQRILTVEEQRTFLKEIERSLSCLIERDPDNQEYLKELASVYDEIGDLYHSIGNTSLIKENYSKALHIREQIHGFGDNGSATLLSASYDRLGAAYRLLGRQQEANESYKKAYALQHDLVGSMEVWNFHDVRRYWLITVNLADVRLEQGDIKAAAGLYEKAYDTIRTIHERHEGDPVVTRDAATMMNKLGTTYWLLDNHERADHCYHTSLSMKKRLLDQNPDHPVYLKDVWVSEFHLGNFYEAQGDLKSATRLFLSGYTIMSDLVVRFKGDAEKLKDLVLSCIKLGSIYLSEDRERAVGYIKQGLDIIYELMEKDPYNAEYKISYALLCYYCGFCSKEYEGYFTKSREVIDRLIDMDGTSSVYKEMKERLLPGKANFIRLLINREDLRIHKPLVKIAGMVEKCWHLQGIKDEDSGRGNNETKNKSCLFEL